MAYIKKSYQEIIDDALVKIRGGIVNESHTFAAGENRYILDRSPVAAITVVKGTLAGEPYTFSQGENLDFYLPGENSIQWVDKGNTPDPGTPFYVTYLLRNSDSPITDVNIGSVTRTLVEAFAWEVAVLYNQMQAVYENAFIDTAKGKSLDFLVRLLDMNRIEAGFARGEAAFSRNTPAPADITIPKGTLVSGLSLDEKGEEVPHLYKTAEDGTLRRGETSVNIPIRAETKGIAAPIRGLTTMPKPILGIEEVSNLDDTVLGSKQETDAELRKRTKDRIKGTSTVTQDAILTALLEKDFVTTADVIDRPGNNNGEITVVLDTNRKEVKEVEREVRDRLHAIKAAGVYFDLVFTTKVYPQYKITLTPSTELSDKQKNEIQKELEEKTGAYLRGLSPSETVIAGKIIAIAMGIPKIKAAEIGDVSAYIDEKKDKKEISTQPQGSAVQRLPNGDLVIGEFHKATAGAGTKQKTPVVATFKSPAPQEEPGIVVEVPTQELRVEAYIFIKIMDPSLDELRTKTAIKNAVRAYLSNLFYQDGDTVDFGVILDKVKTNKFNEMKEWVKDKWITRKWGKYLVKVADPVLPLKEEVKIANPVLPLPEEETIPIEETISIVETFSFEQDTEKYTFLRLVHSGDGLEKILLSDSHKEPLRKGEVIADPEIYIYFERSE